MGWEVGGEVTLYSEQEEQLNITDDQNHQLLFALTVVPSGILIPGDTVLSTSVSKVSSLCMTFSMAYVVTSSDQQLIFVDSKQESHYF